MTDEEKTYTLTVIVRSAYFEDVITMTEVDIEGDWPDYWVDRGERLWERYGDDDDYIEVPSEYVVSRTLKADEPEPKPQEKDEIPTVEPTKSRIRQEER